MCGRYSLAATSPAIAQRFAAADRVGSWHERFNCKPTMSLPIVRQAGDARVLAPASWGWYRQFGAKKTFLINAVGEEAPVKKTWAAAYCSRRCLVPASSYFEWMPKAAKTPPRPFAFARRDRALLAIAGLWEEVDAPGGTEVRFVLLTMAANSVVTPVHHRMAAVLLPEDEAAWLDPAASPQRLDAALHALPDVALEAWEVGRAVSLTGAKAVDGPHLLTPRADLGPD